MAQKNCCAQPSCLARALLSPKAFCWQCSDRFAFWDLKCILLLLLLTPKMLSIRKTRKCHLVSSLCPNVVLFVEYGRQWVKRWIQSSVISRWLITAFGSRRRKSEESGVLVQIIKLIKLFFISQDCSFLNYPLKWDCFSQEKRFSWSLSSRSVFCRGVGLHEVPAQQQCQHIFRPEWHIRKLICKNESLSNDGLITEWKHTVSPSDLSQLPLFGKRMELPLPLLVDILSKEKQWSKHSTSILQ